MEAVGEGGKREGDGYWAIRVTNTPVGVLVGVVDVMDDFAGRDGSSFGMLGVCNGKSKAWWIPADQA